MEITELNDQLRELKRRKDLCTRLKRELDSAKYERDVLQSQLHAFMEDHEVGAITHDDVSFVPKETIFGYVQDDVAFEAWCKANQVEDIYLKTEEEKARISELVRESIDSGKELPPGVTFYVRQYIAVTEKK